MVKDKINYRARGPNTQLTRQPVHGRANDGGLRIGEMERDVIIGHGASKFLNDSLMNRADEFSLAVCNKTGTIAIYNNNLNLFMSPSADGPIQYKTDISGEKNIIQITKFGRSHESSFSSSSYSSSSGASLNLISSSIGLFNISSVTSFISSGESST